MSKPEQSLPNIFQSRVVQIDFFFQILDSCFGNPFTDDFFNCSSSRTEPINLPESPLGGHRRISTDELLQDALSLLD